MIIEIPKMPQKIMITGGRGLLGRQLEREFSQSYEIVILGREEADITDYNKVRDFVISHKPDIIIHAAAYTKVDKAEEEIDEAFKLNAIGSKNIAIISEEINAKLVAISTDYIFDGTLDRAYTEYDIACPISAYGRSKYAGEKAIATYSTNYIIARVSWLYGLGGPSFLHTMKRLADEGRDEIRVVDDQLGNPTSTIAVARALHNIIKSEIDLTGIIHFTCEGEASWFDLATKFFELMKIDQKVSRCTTDTYPTPAKRPANSRLDKMNLRLYNLPPMPNWIDSLKEFIELERW